MGRRYRQYLLSVIVIGASVLVFCVAIWMPERRSIGKSEAPDVTVAMGGSVEINNVRWKMHSIAAPRLTSDSYRVMPENARTVAFLFSREPVDGTTPVDQTLAICGDSVVDSRGRHWDAGQDLPSVSSVQWFTEHDYQSNCTLPGPLAVVRMVPQDATIVAVDIRFGDNNRPRMVRFSLN